MKKTQKEAKKHEKDGSITHYDDNNQSAFNWQVMGKYHFANEDTLALSYYDRTRFPTLKETLYHVQTCV